jgi:2-polyprenyl-3-methyl-5-hydroxy-6-metoxy-1,4-benzoquinol methylase
LDFGAGTGRLSFALAGEFDEVCAVDHSETMRGELQRRGQTAGLKIRIVDQLPEDETFDFVLSLLVLQHLPGRRAMARTFSALLNRVAPGGGFAIEVPLRPHNALSYLQPRFHAYAFARFLGIPARFLRRVGLSGISMRSLPEDRIRLVIGAAGCRLLDVKVRSADRWQYALYLGARPPSPSEH